MAGSKLCRLGCAGDLLLVTWQGARCEDVTPSTTGQRNDDAIRHTERRMEDGDFESIQQR